MENLTTIDDCTNGVPSVEEFFASLGFIHKWILIIPVGFFVMTLTLYAVNLCTIVKYGQRDTKSNVLMLLTLYPVSILLHHMMCLFLKLILSLFSPSADCCTRFADLNLYAKNILFL
jgi:hypothetical protein